jgi:hypothetical protein
MNKIVYAVSTETGIFEYLIVLDSIEVIQDEIQTEDGTYICEYISEGQNDSFFYIEKLEF